MRFPAPAVLAAACLVFPVLAGCKKKQKPPPSSLASLSPKQACRHFFGRVKRCADEIHSLRADKANVKGKRRQGLVRQLNKRLRRSLANLDRVCGRYALKKTRKEQTRMDGCYRERTCDGFARCFVKMADEDLKHEKGGRPNTLEELRKQLKELKKLRPASRGGPHSGHMHPRGMRPARRPGPRIRRTPGGRPALKTTPRPPSRPRP